MALDPQERHLSLLAALRPEMRLREGESFAIWQEKARERLRALLGLPLETAPMDFRLLETREWEGGAVAHRFLFASEPGVDVNCQLLLPARARREKVPLVICLQGHSTGMHISLGEAKYPGDEATIAGGDRDFARQAVARGQAALAFDQRGFGERGGTPDGPACHQIAMQALLLGRTLIGERCWDVFRAIDATLAHFPQIDAQKIALMGNSAAAPPRFTPRRSMRGSLPPCPPARSAAFCPPSVRSAIARAIMCRASRRNSIWATSRA